MVRELGLRRRAPIQESALCGPPIEVHQADILT